ncbi:hypothetical protein ACWEKT_15890 [Nocardia takedensis]|uniref:hypothetical protein n=1 Tax=Nocardia takedensis TaxID=259390 RepID=UPI0002DE077B|nr:hypothetical protein [Nocardia takedensis]
MTEERFPDHTRTTRTHAGESIEDTRNWPGILLAAVGIVSVGLALTASGYGYEGWAIIAGIVAVVCLAGGALLVWAEHRRVRRQEPAHEYDDHGH